VIVGGQLDATLTRQQAAQAWADAVQAWAVGIIPPSTTVTAACATLSTSLASIFAVHATPYAGPAMDAAFAAFALTVGGGMAGYVPVPPVAPLGLSSPFATNQPDHATAATAVAALVDAWMRTGVSTLVAPPNTPVPWS
jgi:hypothetical protein